MSAATRPRWTKLSEHVVVIVQNILRCSDNILRCRDKGLFINDVITRGGGGGLPKDDQ